MQRFKEGLGHGFDVARRRVWRHHHGGFRFWFNIITIVLLIVVLVAARHELGQAWNLLGRANIWLILLLIPLQFASYYANTEIFFSYLRARGQLKQVTPLQATGMSLEFTFVNHVFPSAGVAGAGYMVWRLGRHGVPAGQATMTQVMRIIVQFGTFMCLMAAALVWATIEDRTANWVVVATAVAVTVLFFVVAFGNYVFGSKERIASFSHWLSKWVNKVVEKVTFGRRANVLTTDALDQFFFDFHDDLTALKANKVLLKRPIIWSFAFNVLDVSLFFVTFLALGTFVNPAILLIAYGAATVGGGLMITPGGVGAYEAVMVSILLAGGVPAAAALAGVILTRALLLAGTISTGFFVYQHAIHKYGRPVDKCDKSVDKPAKNGGKAVDKVDKSYGKAVAKSVAKSVKKEGNKRG